MKKRSRKIPPTVSDAVKTRHYFECAWCGTKLTERHHIKEFAEGGEHTADNLILLCPTCHRDVHRSDTNINIEDLKLRKSTHLKGDRIGGNLQFDVSKNKIRLGETFFEGFDSLVNYGDEKIIYIELINGEYYLSSRFYGRNGDLLFWMSKNRYWAPISFKVEVEAKCITISNKLTNDFFLKIWQDEDFYSVLGSSYRNGNSIIMNSNKVAVGAGKQITIQGSGTIIGNGGAAITM